jgi:hypothetical protein
VNLLNAADHRRSNCGTRENIEKLHIGQCVMFRDRVYVVRGMSPMGVVPCRVQLEDEAMGELLEADADKLHSSEPQRHVPPA